MIKYKLDDIKYQFLAELDLDKTLDTAIDDFAGTYYYDKDDGLALLQSIDMDTFLSYAERVLKAMGENTFSDLLDDPAELANEFIGVYLRDQML